MHRLLVLYNEPKDPAHFKKYYVETHVPLANKLPGIKNARYSFDMKPLGPGKAPYFCIFEADFDTETALEKTLKVGQQSTFVVFSHGHEVARSTGQTQEPAIREILQKAL